MFNTQRESSVLSVYLALCWVFVSNLLPLSPSKVAFLLPFILLSYIFRISLKWNIFCWSSGALLLLIQLLFTQYGLVVKGTYFSLFDRWFSLNRWILGKISDWYSKEVWEVIGLFVFNLKKTETYYLFNDFGISHLFSVSGLHIFLLSKCLSKLIRNRKIVFLILFIYWIALGYSIPALRVLLTFLLWKKQDKLERWAWVTLLSLPFNIHIYSSLSFLLSYFFSFMFLWNERVCSSKKTLWAMDITTASILSSLVFLPLKPHKLYPLIAINTLIFTPIAIFLFVYFFSTWFLFFLEPIHLFLSRSFLSLRESFSLNTSHVLIDYWDFDMSHIGLIILSLLLIGCYNYTTQKTKGYWIM